MSALSSLKFVAAKRPTQMPAVQVRRNKLVGKLHHQLLLAKALSEGNQYTPIRLRTVKDRHTGQSKTVEMPIRVKSWWFVSDNGSVVLQVKYGSKVIDIQKGKNSIEIKDGNHLIEVLETIKNATIAGELDSQIENAANIVKSRFKK